MAKELENEKEKQEQGAGEVSSEPVNVMETENNNDESNEATDDKSQKIALGEADKEAEAVTNSTGTAKKDRKKPSKKDNGKVSFIELFVASFADVTAISALTFILLFLAELILGLMGYIVKDKISIYLIIFIFTSIVYAPICTKTKLRATIGQKLFFLEVKKDN